MKTVMSGAALAAILALAMPAWADAPSAHRSHGKSAHASMSHAQKGHAARGSHARKMSNRNMDRQWSQPTTSRMSGSSPTDNVANDLNRAEAQRLMTGGSTPPMGGPNMGPMGNPNMGPMGGPAMAPMGAPNQPPPVPGQ